MSDTTPSVAGLRILIVEDELLVALGIEDILTELNCEPVGPVSTIENAIEIIRSEAKIDGVLLDMNLHGEPVFPVVDELIARSIAFVLLTGYRLRADDPPTVRNASRLIKPFTMATLSEAMAKAFIRSK